MSENISPTKSEQFFFLLEVVGSKVSLRGKKIGNLDDFVIIDGDVAGEVTHLYVGRPFGEPSLVIPWDKVRVLNKKETVVDIDSIDNYIADASKSLLLLKDDILDKKVLDVEGKEIEVVYDVKLVLKNNKLYVIEVDMSHYGLLRRMGLKRLADFISNLGESLKAHTIPWKYVEPLPAQIGSFEGNLRLNLLKEKLSEMHPADAADVLEEMDQEQRIALFDVLDMEHASNTLEEIDPNVQRTILASLSKKKIAQLVNEMTPAQAADVLAVLPSSDASEVLSLLKKENVGKIRDILEKHEQKILNYATTSFVKYSPEMTVRQALEQYRRIATVSDVIMYLYIVDEQERLLGVIDMRELLRASNDSVLRDVMVPIVAKLNTGSTLREAMALFRRYSFRAIPVVDDSGKILGVVPYRDMMNLKHAFLE